MTYTIRYNARTTHIEGIPERTKVRGDGEDNGSGVVAYYATSACASLSRSGHKMAVGASFEDLAEALGNARLAARVNNRNLCKRCEAAAERAIAEQAADENAARIAEAGSKAAAANTHLSPTAQALVAASAARDEAMKIAHEAEGTDGQNAADAAYEAAEAAYRAAGDAHHAAREAAGDFLPIAEKRAARDAAAEDDTAIVTERHDYEDGGWSEITTGLHVQKKAGGSVHFGRRERGYNATSGDRSDVVSAVCGAGGSRRGVSAHMLRTSPFKIVGADVDITCRNCAKAIPCDQVRDGARCWRTGDHKVHMINGYTWTDDAPAPKAKSNTVPSGRVDGLRLRKDPGAVVHDGYRTSSGTWATCGTGGGTGWGELGSVGAKAAVTCKRCVLKIAEAEATAAAARQRKERWSAATADANAERAYDLAYREAKYTAERAAVVSTDEADAVAEGAYERYREAADKIDRCLIFGCEANTGPYRSYCAEHDVADDAEDAAPAAAPTATVDHTEPGKAVAVLTHAGGTSQAWLSLEDRGWVLTDDYEDETISVNAIGVDVAVTEWALRKGLGPLRSITITYEYAPQSWTRLSWRTSDLVHLGRRRDDGTVMVLCAQANPEGWHDRDDDTPVTCVRCLGAAGGGLTPAAEDGHTGPVTLVIQRSDPAERERRAYSNAYTRVKALDTPNAADFADIATARKAAAEVMAAKGAPADVVAEVAALPFGRGLRWEDYHVLIREP